MVEPELLGVSIPFSIDHQDVTVVFPTTAGGADRSSAAATRSKFDDQFPRRENFPVPEGAREIFAELQLGGASDLKEVHTLRVEVVIPHAAFQASDFGEHGVRPDVLDRARRDTSRAGNAADRAVEGLLAWVRVRHHQAWLGLFGESANRSGADEFVDLDAGRRIPWVHGADPLTVRVVERDTPLNAARVDVLRPSIEAGNAPELADVLMADAGFLAESAEPRDPSRAVLVCGHRLRSEDQDVPPRALECRAGCARRTAS